MANTVRYPIDITSLGAYLLISRYEFGGNQFSTAKMFDIGNFSYTEQMQLGDVMAVPVPNNIVDGTSAQWNDSYEMSFSKEIAKQVFQKLGMTDNGVVNTAVRSGARTKGYTWAKANVLNYEGTNTKTYSMNWTFIPQSKAEADAVEKICDTFELGMLSNLSSKDSVYQYYPDIFRIQAVGVNRMAFLPCIIENIEVDMSSEGNFQAMSDGNLPQYTVTVQFKEITNRTKDTYNAIRQGKNV